MLYATNIVWDTDGDRELADSLPKKILLPDELQDGGNPDEEDVFEDAVSDYLSDETGFCHYGFDIVDI